MIRRGNINVVAIEIKREKKREREGEGEREKERNVKCTSVTHGGPRTIAKGDSINSSEPDLPAKRLEIELIKH